ncbi:hypothetical protein FE257_004265 [Aspergillus nanangensis]|uniref:Rhodopsin domain-containing protein n=1 Tax=Aspergillus nanangensis TaxID=2582783 RepID=A0AAD4CRJ9_ASPNN|nr:hypothetical protein FE257_004265 [Aspergillus nanangensis]
MGWVHNLDTPHPGNNIAKVIGVCLAFSITACVAVALRFYVRVFIRKSTWFDDYAALFSAVMAMAYASLAVAQTRWGLGIVDENFPPENIVPYGKIQYAGGPIYSLALFGFKVSLLASYLRIGGFVRIYRIICIVATVACGCKGIAFTFVLLFSCRPIAKQWDASIPGTCINTVASYYALAGTSLVFDVIIIGLPLPVLFHLQLQIRQKIVLMVVFALGFFVTVIQIVRIFTIGKLQTYTDSEPIIIWSDIEISLGVIICCIPTYGPLFKSFAPGFSSYRNRRSSGSFRLQSLMQKFQTTRTSTSRSRQRDGSQKSRDDNDYPAFGEDVVGVNHPLPPAIYRNYSYSTMVRSRQDEPEGDDSSEKHILKDEGRGPVAGNCDPEPQVQKLMEVKVERHNV